MLDNERYNGALASLKQSIDSGSCILDPSTNKQALLEQQLITQQTLKRLGIDKSTLPQDIPDIEKPICHQKVLRPTNIFVSLIGSPNSGRSSALKSLSLSPADFGRVAYEVMKKINKDKVDYNLLAKIQIQTANVWHSHSKDKIYFDWLLGIDNDTNIIFERDWGDLPFIRANFLFGRIDVSILKMAEENFYRQLDSHPMTPKVIINTFISPQTSLEREKEVKTHNVVQLPFLNVLYEQNLRFHYEMTLLAQNQTPSFNYLAIDMSDSQIGVNITHLLESINLMVKNF